MRRLHGDDNEADAALLMFNRQTKPGWMAITLQAQHYAVAHVERAPGAAPRVSLLARPERSGKPTEAVQSLQALRRSLNLQRYRCTTLLDGAAYQLVQINAPTVPAEELRAATRWAVKDVLDFPAEQAVIDVLLVPPDGAPQGRAPLALAIAARREPVAERVQGFQQAGVPLQAIEIAETAQRNVAALFEQPGRGLALLALHEHGLLLTFTRDGELFASRHIDIAPEALHDDADAERRLGLLERIGLEMQRSLDNFDRQFSQIALQRVLVCAPAGCNALMAYLKQNLYQPVEAAELGEVLDLSAFPDLAPPGAQAPWLLTLGLALREEAS